MAVVAGGHVLVVEFHVYFYHLIDALPDYDLPRIKGKKKGSLFENEVCEPFYVKIEKVDGSIKEYNNVLFPKSYARTLEFYLYDTEAIFFPCYEFHTLSTGVVLRHALLQTGRQEPHTVLIPELMLINDMADIRSIQWSSNYSSYRCDLIEVVTKRTPTPKLIPRKIEKSALFSNNGVDLRPICPPIIDQGDLGTCGVAAIVSLLEFITGEKLSILFLYWITRVKISGFEPEDDAGVELPDVMSALGKYGICREETWPYITTKFLDLPSQQAFNEAKKFIPVNFKPLHTLDEMKDSLERESPFFIDVMFTGESYGNGCMKSGKIPKPEDTVWDDACVHSCLIVGYNDTSQELIFQNSWGDNWGIKGHGTLPYDYIKHSLFKNAYSWGTEKPHNIFD